MFHQSDIWDRAAGCDCASRSHSDLQRRAALELLRDMWIAVANELPYLTPRELAAQVEIVEGIGSCLCGRVKQIEPASRAVWTGVAG